MSCLEIPGISEDEQGQIIQLLKWAVTVASFLMTFSLFLLVCTLLKFSAQFCIVFSDTD